MEYFEFLSQFYDLKTIKELKEALNNKPYFGLRINKYKYPYDLDLSKLEKHPYVKDAYIFNKEEYSFGKYNEHDCGCYYIQDPSASMVVEILHIKEDDLVIDLCAAPGGKSTQASLLTNNTIYCNDISFSRSLDLLENIERLGIDNSIILNDDPNKFCPYLKGLFDKVILDAPCSGEGMFRKSKDVENDWSIDKVNSLIPIQKSLILNAYSLLKKGGLMTYSTCTYNFKENEEIIKYLLENTNAKLINIKEYPSLIRSPIYKETIHILPSKFKGEGHYIALIKCEDENNSNIKQLKSIIDNKSLSIYRKFEKECLDEKLDQSRLYLVKNNLYYLPNTTFNLKNINILKYGLYLGEIKDNYFMPSHHLGSSFKIKWKNKINFSPNSKETRDYIKGLSFKVENTNNGFNQVCIDNNPIGICKISNNTLKNLYPKKLRK